MDFCAAGGVRPGAVPCFLRYLLRRVICVSVCIPAEACWSPCWALCAHSHLGVAGMDHAEWSPFHSASFRGLANTPLCAHTCVKNWGKRVYLAPNPLKCCVLPGFLGSNCNLILAQKGFFFDLIERTGRSQQYCSSQKKQQFLGICLNF